MNWKTLLKQSLIQPKDLLKQLELPESLLNDLNIGHSLFPLRVTQSFINRMEKGNPQDPLLLQVLPLEPEAVNPPEFIDDPLQEQTANPLPGLLHKYQSRVLLITSGACAVNCRFCFRRNFPYDTNNPGTEGWEHVLAYIAQDLSIHEVILSGGDPLTLTDISLKNLLQGLEAIPHVTTLRIHSRIPIILPERIESDFITLFQRSRLQKVMVLHINHPNELDDSVKPALANLKIAGFQLLNQAVLLRGINDSADTQIILQRKLFQFGILPYYLHLLDRAKGTAHFEVSLAEAQCIICQMMDALPGYLVPKLVQEVPGKPSKQVIPIHSEH